MGRERRNWQALGRRWRWHLLVAAVVAVYAYLFYSRLDYLVWHDDEAVFTLTAKAVHDGYALYRQVWFNYLPGFIRYLSGAYTVLGYSLTTARLAVFAFGLFALATAYGIGRLLRSPAAGALSLLLLATAPHFCVLSSAVMTEVPAFALAASAVLAGLLYLRSGRRGWLLAGGGLFALAVLFKLTTLFAAPVFLLALYLGEETWRERLIACAVLLGAAGTTLALGLIGSDLGEMWRQIGGTAFDAGQAFRQERGENLSQLYQYFWRDKYGLHHLSLLLLGGLGLAALWRERRRAALLMGAWFFMTLLELMLHVPIYRHHLVAILFPLAPLAGIGLAYAAGELLRRSGGVRLALIYLLLLLALIEFRDSAWASLTRITTYEAERFDITQDAIDYVAANTAPDDGIVTDGSIIALRSRRRVPPDTVNVSRMRIETGELTDAQLIDRVRAADPALIVFWEKKLTSLDDFATWVGCQYDLVQEYDERHRIYARRPERLPDDLVASEATFSDQIKLLGYTLSSPGVRAGEKLELILYWEALTPAAGDYKVFLHLLDGEGNRIAQDDTVPRQWFCPTYVWQPGELIVDPHGIEVESTGEGGPYRLLVGLYGRDDGQRLAPDHIELTTVPALEQAQ